MKILKAKYILTCNDKFEILEDCAVCFEKTILDIDKLEKLVEIYPEAEVVELPENSVIMPGLINPHVHLEFSSNKSSLKYGSFITWLNSVIQNRDDLLSTCSDEVMEKQLKIMQKSGTTSFGAISSFGNDLDVCFKSPQRVVFFAEVLGSNPSSIDILFNDFKSRLKAVEENQSDRLIPAISVHSPYSTHPILAKYALKIAQDKNYVVSTHFMESQAEREWLDKGRGEFNEFFKNFAPNSKPMSNADDYLALFKDNKTLFTHCVQATDDELEIIKEQGGSVTHCPTSNRFLGTGKLDVSKLDEFTLGTDGLSSNNSLNLWDEMRTSLMSHTDMELNELAIKLLKAVTTNGAKALHVDAGTIEKGKLADINICELKIEDIEDIPVQLILHTKFTKATYIAGEKI